jgi:hypothetical protein
MEIEKLKQFKEFINCYDINECLDMIEKDGSIETIKGYITIECHHIYGYVDVIHIPITIYLDEWDELEKNIIVKAIQLIAI